MKIAEMQGQLWSRKSNNWASIQEPMHIPLWNTMLDQALVGADTQFLDVGCGGGGASLLATKRGAKVSGLDAAEGLIKIARERMPGGDFRVGYLDNLPYEDHSFDAVFAANSVQYSEDRITALRELGRVCKPGGRIVAGLFGPPEKVKYSVILEAIGDANPTPSPGGGPFELSAPGVLTSLFLEVGLNVLEIGEVDCPFSYPDFETFYRATSSAGPFQGLLQVVGEEKLIAVLREAVEPFRLDGRGYLIQPNYFHFIVASR